MDTKVLNQQSQHWEKNFSSKPEMFGLEPSLPAKNSLKLFKESKISKIVEFGAGLGRDTIFFAKNSIHVTAVDYSSSGLKVINDKAQKQSLSNLISTKLFDVRKKLPFEDNSFEAFRNLIFLSFGGYISSILGMKMASVPFAKEIFISFSIDLG